MATLTRSVTIDAPIEEVFESALDVGQLWGSAPDVAVAEVSLEPEGVGTKAKIWTHALGIHMEGDIEYTEVSAPEQIVAQVAFGPERPQWLFTFESADGGATTMTGQGQWQVHLPAMGKQLGKQLEEWMAKSHTTFLETLLDNFKAKCESAAN